MSVSGIVFILSVILASGDILDEQCRTLPDGKMTPHPDNCEYFVECYGGYPYVRKCGAGLHFNIAKGVCDYPHLSNCGRGGSQSHYNNPYTGYASRRPESTPVHRFVRPDNEIHLRGSVDDGSYEETVYGMAASNPHRNRGDDYDDNHRNRGRVHVDFAMPVKRPVSSFPGGRRQSPISGRRKGARWWPSARNTPLHSQRLPSSPPYIPLADERRKARGGPLSLGGRSGSGGRRHGNASGSSGRGRQLGKWQRGAFVSGRSSVGSDVGSGRAPARNSFGGRRHILSPHARHSFPRLSYIPSKQIRPSISFTIGSQNKSNIISSRKVHPLKTRDFPAHSGSLLNTFMKHTNLEYYTLQKKKRHPERKHLRHALWPLWYDNTFKLTPRYTLTRLKPIVSSRIPHKIKMVKGRLYGVNLKRLSKKNNFKRRSGRKLIRRYAPTITGRIQSVAPLYKTVFSRPYNVSQLSKLVKQVQHQFQSTNRSFLKKGTPHFDATSTLINFPSVSLPLAVQCTYHSKRRIPLSPPLDSSQFAKASAARNSGITRGDRLGLWARDISEMKSYASVVMEDAKHQVRERLNREIYISQQMTSITDSKPFAYVSHFLDAKPYAKALSKCGMAITSCLKLMSKRFHSPGNEILNVAREMGLEGGLLKPLPGTHQPDTRMPIPPDIDYCPYPRDYACDVSSHVRTVDGTCNNLNTPIFGRSMSPFRRLMPANYADGVDEARMSVTGGPLPGARKVSLNLFPDVDRPHAQTSMLLVFWGQLTDHDLTLTAITEVQTDDGPLGETEELKCGFDGCQTGQPGLEACWPIPVPEEDPDFPYNRCLKFVRDVEVPQLDCRLGHREQLNQATHWLDASMVYGNNIEEQNKLRDFSDRARGPMKVSDHPLNNVHGVRGSHKPLLPHGEDPFCRGTNETVQCFAGGDERVNENAGLCTFHTILVREHNRIEQQLHFLNPHWEGERLYQDTKRIINAFVQHITYNEFLPLVLGPDLMRKNDIVLQRSGYFYGYDARVDPRIPNSFAAAAFRFGHTLLQEKLNMADEQYNIDDSLFLSSALNRPEIMYRHGGVDKLLRGLSLENSQTFDQFFTKQISRHLFSEDPPHAPSMDLISLNIMRSRDHGLPTYNQFREWCGLGRAYSFDDLSPEIPDSRARKALSSVYRHVDDIDIFAGGVSERSVRGGLVGPTFGCIIAETFKNLRKGDRFWYENDGIFTADQLQQIRKVTLSKVLCRNSDNVKKFQPWAMLSPTKDRSRNAYEIAYQFASNPDQILDDIPDGLTKDGHYNPLIPCDDLPDIDLTKWVNGPYTVHK